MYGPSARTSLQSPSSDEPGDLAVVTMGGDPMPPASGGRDKERTMPIIGRQCSRDLKTVCQRMSEASLPVNQSGPGLLTLVYGWANEDRKAQGISAAVQGIELVTSAGRLLPLDHCPWCGGGIVSSSGSVRTNAGAAPAHKPPPPPAPEPAPRSRETPRGTTPPSHRADSEPAPAPRAMHVQGDAAIASAALKSLREKLGISQAELGEKLGLARSTIANYENGRAPLSERLRKWMEKNEKKKTR